MPITLPYTPNLAIVRIWQAAQATAVFREVVLKSIPAFMLCLSLACTGCRGPFKTNSQVSLNGPVTAHLIAEVPAKSNAGPLVPMRVEAGDESRIAVVDVDGLLVNQNNTVPFAGGEPR